MSASAAHLAKTLVIWIRARRRAPTPTRHRGISAASKILLARNVAPRSLTPLRRRWPLVSESFESTPSCFYSRLSRHAGSRERNNPAQAVLVWSEACVSGIGAVPGSAGAISRSWPGAPPPITRSPVDEARPHVASRCCIDRHAPPRGQRRGQRCDLRVRPIRPSRGIGACSRGRPGCTGFLPGERLWLSRASSRGDRAEPRRHAPKARGTRHECICCTG